jgi:hypothetical protein
MKEPNLPNETDLPVLPLIFAVIMMIWIIPVIMLFLFVQFCILSPLNYLLKLRKGNEN